MQTFDRYQSRLRGASVSATRSPGNVRGFTLIELIIAIVIVAVLAAIALPSMSSLIVRHKVQDAGSDLFAALIKTRSEALKRNADVSLASITGTDWTSGWQILDPSSAVIDTHSALSHTGPEQTLTVTATGPNPIIYQSTGRISGGGRPEFIITGTNGHYTYKSCVRVDPSGRPYTLGTSQGTSC